MPDLIDSATAAFLAGVPVEDVRAAVRAGRLTNYGGPRAYRLDPREVAEALGDPLGIFG